MTPNEFWTDDFTTAARWFRSESGGKRIALSVIDGGSQDVWVYDPQRDAMTRLTSGGEAYRYPVWSPDGKSIVVARGEGATARGRTITHNAWYDLVSLDAARPGGDTGVVLQRLSAKTLGGADYDNEYCWVYACADGVVHKVTEFADTLNAALIVSPRL